MGIAAGLVGLPNVGKSTLFNALTKSSVPAENYPFCTIDPHRAFAVVPDARCEKLQAIFKSGKIIPASAQFVDIAGLVKGAAEGEGLGNQFLSHIREVDVVIHVLRCFEDANIVHTGSSVDPLADYETIVTELGLKDLESIEKRLAKIEQLCKASKQQTPQQLKALQQEEALLREILLAINAGDVHRVATVVAEQTTPIETVPLLCTKQILVIANVAEHEVADNTYEQNQHYQALVKHFGAERVIPLCAKLEYELSQLPDAEAAEMATMMGLEKSGLTQVIEKTYRTLGLITFFTCGPQEIHAWPIKKGTTIRAAAGEIHSDLERGFICAEVYGCADIFATKSVVALKDQGKVRTEGQNYIVQDGDIVLIKFNV